MTIDNILICKYVNVMPGGVTPLIHQYGETMTATTREDGPSGSPEQSLDVLKKRWPREA
jgi:hypothetical protein